MRKSAGFTLIELLIVVAIIGILAAIAIPNMMDAVDRARQKKSLGEIRTMVIAMQQFSVDYTGHPNSTYNGDPSATWPTVMDNGLPVVVPDLIQSVPHADGWKIPYTYFAGPDGTSPVNGINQVVATHFVVYSPGADTIPNAGVDGSGPGPVLAASWCQNPPIRVGIPETHCLQSDIVWGDSQFVQSPEGKQRRC